MSTKEAQHLKSPPPHYALPKYASDLIGYTVIVYYVFFFTSVNNRFQAASKEGKTIPDLVDDWVVIFLGSMLVELIISLVCARQYNLYRTTDSVSSIAAGTFGRVLLRQIAKASAFNLYSWVWTNFSIYRFPECSASYFALLVLNDFSYYWLHRTGHTIYLLWAAHSVHHSSEEYNLSTALRQSFFHAFFSPFYYIWLALFFSPQLFVVHTAANALYQYWVHTSLVRKLGPIEWIFSTPSQHRVHHARNPNYVDRNYGGIFSVWDRMFGTFQEENDSDPCVFGVIGPVNTYDSWMIQLSPYIKLFQKMDFRQFSLWTNLRVLWEKPGWIIGSKHEEMAAPPVDRVQKYNPHLPASMQVYILLYFLTEIGIYSTGRKLFRNDFLTVAFELLSFTTLGALSNRKSWAPYLEIFRLLLLPFVPLLFRDEFATKFSEAFLGNAFSLLSLVSVLTVWWNFEAIVKPLQQSEIGYDIAPKKFAE